MTEAIETFCESSHSHRAMEQCPTIRCCEVDGHSEVELCPGWRWKTDTIRVKTYDSPSALKHFTLSLDPWFHFHSRKLVEQQHTLHEWSQQRCILILLWTTTASPWKHLAERCVKQSIDWLWLWKPKHLLFQSWCISFSFLSFLD